MVASDLSAFVRVLGSDPAGVTFPAGDAPALAETICRLLADPGERHLLAQRGQVRARTFDWSEVAAQIMAVYELALDIKDFEPDVLPQAETLWGRLVRSGRSSEEE